MDTDRMLKTGIYVDAENIRLCGGYGMRYDVLVDLANVGKSVLLRANSYLAEDRARTKEDPEYRQKLYRYHDVLRQCGFKVIKKYVKHFVDDEGILTTKANADMDLAIDALLQARNLDRVILLTGDGDFIRLVLALQNMGCRVEVIGFKYVSNELKEAADSLSLRLSDSRPAADPGGQRVKTGSAASRSTTTRIGASASCAITACGRKGWSRNRCFFTARRPTDVNDALFLDPRRSLNSPSSKIPTTTAGPRPGISAPSTSIDAWRRLPDVHFTALET